MGSKTTKADKLEAAGDKYASKKEYKKALKKYREALKLDPERDALYDKLVAMQDNSSEEWNMNDFVESLTWTMKKQELSSPSIRQVHAKLSPEWEKATDIALKILMSPEDDSLSRLTDELVSFGEIGTRALVDILRQIRKAGENQLSPSPRPPAADFPLPSLRPCSGQTRERKK